MNTIHTPLLMSRSTISLRSFEDAYHHEIDLANYERELYARTDAQDVFPSSIPFAIPLPSDTPQSIQTPHSTLGHQLTATLYSVDGHIASLSKSLTVHTRRYTLHSHTLPSSPETYSLDDPTRSRFHEIHSYRGKSFLYTLLFRHQLERLWFAKT